MELTTMDVNTAPVESSTTGAETQSAQNQQYEQSFAETLNTDKAQQEKSAQSEYVPYDRFQQVIADKKALEEQINNESFKQYQQWDNLVRQDPAIAQQVQHAIANYYQQIQAQQMNAQNQINQAQLDPQNPLNQVLPYIQQQQMQLNQLVQQQQQATYNRYEAEFNNRVSNNKISDEWKPIYRMLVEKAVVENMPNALQSGFNPNVIDSAFNSVHKQLSSLMRSQNAQYIQDKSKDVLPPSTSGSGATPRIVSGDNTPESRAAELISLLKA